MTIELVPLGTMTGHLRPPIGVGNRMIFELEDGHMEGERIRAKLSGQANADWLTTDAYGIGNLDVRMLVETDDGALVFIQYLGKVDFNTPGAAIYATPRFETSDERYLWLNGIQAVAKGVFDGTSLTYELYELR